MKKYSFEIVISLKKLENFEKLLLPDKNTIFHSCDPYVQPGTLAKGKAQYGRSPYLDSSFCKNISAKKAIYLNQPARGGQSY